jgi:hypothetical protein
MTQQSSHYAMTDQVVPLDSHQLRAQLLDVVQHQATQQPRNLQVRMGPSGLGDPCTLSLAYQLLEWQQSNADSDPLPSVVGTGAHAMFAGFFEARDERLADGRARYLVETRVVPRHDIPGSSDLFDRATGTVIDWKFQGKAKLDELKRHGPSRKYRVQAHTYGLGFENAGEHVQHVAIVGVPRGGFLSGTVVWTEPYDRQIALDALQRKDQVLELVGALAVEDHPKRWGLIPRLPGPGCRYCPFFRPGSTDLSKGCPGHMDGTASAPPTVNAFLGQP